MTSTDLSSDHTAATRVGYDPYSPEAMTDPRDLYAQLRARGPVHYLPDYNAWALASFEAVWQVARDHDNFTFVRGMPPNSALLGEPTTVSFTALPNEEHLQRRRILRHGYRHAAADEDEQHIRTTARAVLEPLLARPDRRMDVYRDYSSRVAAQFAGAKVGLPPEDAERIRRRCDDIFAREPGQKGTSEANRMAAMEVGAYLHELVARARQDRSLAHGDLAALLDATTYSRPLTDEEIVGDLFTLLVTGSETTETAAAATVYYLAQHPEQLAEVRADHGLIPFAFTETVRYDHPTDLLCREVLNEVEVCGQTLRPGQPVLMLWGSASRDESEFPNANVYDIHRRYQRHLLYGQGQHRCLGEHLALRMGTVILDELFSAIGDFEVNFDACTRRCGEFLKGFNAVPITFTPR